MVSVASLPARLRALPRWRPSPHGQGPLAALARMSDASGAPISRLMADFAALAIAGRQVIRAAVFNHRTTAADIDGFFADAVRLAAELG